MREKVSLFFQKEWVTRVLILVFSSVVILGSAASCSLFGGDSDEGVVLGVLKRDPAIKADGFGKINRVQLASGEVDSQGLTNISVYEIKQASTNIFYILTKEKGVFRSDDSGRNWSRKYIFNSDDDNQKIEKNDDFVGTDLAVDSTNPSVIYVSGYLDSDEIGKIYKSTDGGASFEEVYTEVEDDTFVNFVAVSPYNGNVVFAAIEGGSVIKSDDGGSTWQKVRNFDDTPVQLSFVEATGELYLVLDDDGIAVSSDYGNRWEVHELEKADSNIGEDQASDSIIPIKTSRVKSYQKAEKVDSINWLVVADKQLWQTSDLNQPLEKVVLPLETEKLDLMNFAIHPSKGINEIWVSVGNKLFVSKNRGQSWDTNDKIQITDNVGRISDILIDENNDSVVYLTLVSERLKKKDGVFK